MPTPIPSPSAICLVNNTAISTSNTSGIDVIGGSTITISLEAIAGVDSWAISASSADDITYSNGNLVAVNNSKVQTTPYSATFVVPNMIGIRGCALQFTSIVNAGKSNENRITLGVWVINTNGTRLFFGAESYESNATVGNAADLNKLFSLGIEGATGPQGATGPGPGAASSI